MLIIVSYTLHSVCEAEVKGRCEVIEIIDLYIFTFIASDVLFAITEFLNLFIQVSRTFYSLYQGINHHTPVVDCVRFLINFYIEND